MSMTKTKEISSDPHRLLTISQVKEMLGVSEGMVFKLLKSKKDPIPSLTIGTLRRFQLDKVLWWIEKHEK